MSVHSHSRLGVLLLLLLSLAATLPVARVVQAADAVKKAKLPEIADEPKTIDPATLMPPKLAAVATVDFSNASLREMVDWLQNEKKITVLLENNVLSEIGIIPSEPVSDRLDNAPIYLMLNRLRSLGLAWYVEDEILHITTIEAAGERSSTIPYNIGDLLDAGYEPEVLTSVIESTVSPECWSSFGGKGSLSLLGDVMFVRQPDALQREVQGLLAALRNHGRQTFALDARENLTLRQKLDTNVSIAFLDTPLEAAVAELSKKTGADIRLDLPTLREMHVRQREPITLKLADRKLNTVLQAMISNLDLTWILRDGVLWITSKEVAENFRKTAVYDVRDLCRDEGESDALEDAIISGTGSDWTEYGGSGCIEFAKPGVMVVHHQERVLMEVLDLLETYRTALRSSKPRKKKTVDPSEVITVYYRLHENVAISLQTLLPELVEPDAWANENQPTAPGRITYAASPPDLFSDKGRLAQAAAKQDQAASAVAVSRAVLIIRQTRAAHDEIAKIIQRIESGDVAKTTPRESAMPCMGGMGGGMGGFGSGFMSVPAEKKPKE